jgi:hypothetical protein
MKVQFSLASLQAVRDATECAGYSSSCFQLPLFSAWPGRFLSGCRLSSLAAFPPGLPDLLVSHLPFHFVLWALQ